MGDDAELGQRTQTLRGELAALEARWQTAVAQVAAPLARQADALRARSAPREAALGRLQAEVRTVEREVARLRRREGAALRDGLVAGLSSGALIAGSVVWAALSHRLLPLAATPAVLSLWLVSRWASASRPPTGDETP